MSINPSSMNPPGINFLEVNTFIPNSNPNKFGARNQKQYRAWMKQMQREKGEDIKQLSKEKPALVEFFYSVIESLSQARREIAVRHKTPDSSQFGERRDAAKKFVNASFTPFVRREEYGKYANIILNRMAQELTPLNLQERSKEIKSTDQVVDHFDSSHSSSIKIEVLEAEHLAAKKFSIGPGEGDYPDWYSGELHNKVALQNNFSEAELESLYRMNKRLKNECPQFYERRKTFESLMHINHDFPSPQKINNKFVGNSNNYKSFYAFATLRIKVGKQMFAGTKWITWLYRDGEKTPPVEGMVKKSAVVVIHMDKYLIDDTLKKIADLFAEAVCSGSENQVDLQKYVGLMRYYFAHCMPWTRGSAAIAEALEGAIYYAGGFNVSHNPQMLVDLEALSTPKISEFMEKYPEMVQLTPILAPAQDEEKS